MISATVQHLLDALPDAKPAGSGKWAALCPVHEADGNGHRPSLSIGIGDDGKVLLHCFGGCATSDILRAIGLTDADLFPPKSTAAHRPARPGPQTARPAHVYALPCLAAKALAKSTGGRLAGWWTYLRADGSEALTELRFHLPLPADAQEGDKPPKTCRPIHPNGDGWCIGNSPDRLLPPYNLTAARSAKRVYLVEGPGKVDEMTRLGLTAITSAYGASAACKTDWRFLAGKEIIGLPDNDVSGQGYVQEVGAIVTALDPPAVVKIVTLPGLPESGDICDWLAADGPMDAHDNDEIKGAIEALANAAPPWTPGPADTKAAVDDAEAEIERGVFVRLSDVAPQPVNWLWIGRLALGKLAVLAGNAGVGKSCLTLDLTARVTRGDGFPDCPASLPGPGGVVLLSAEDDLADTIRPRLDAAGADVSRVLALTTVKHYDPERKREVFASFNLTTDLSILESGIAKVENCRLVIIDPISAFLGGADSHNNSEVRGLLAPLAELAARHHVAIVAVSHLNKGAGDALARVMGSIAFVAAARHVYAVAKDRKDPSRRLCLPVKNNLGVDNTGLAYRLIPVAGGVPRVVWEPGTVAVSADEAVAPVDQRRGPEAEGQEEARAWLTDFLANGPRPAVDCYAEAARVGITRATLLRAKPAAGVLAGKDGYNGPWTWRLPGYENIVLPMKTEGTHEGTQTPLF